MNPQQFSTAALMRAPALHRFLTLRSVFHVRDVRAMQAACHRLQFLLRGYGGIRFLVAISSPQFGLLLFHSSPFLKNYSTPGPPSTAALINAPAIAPPLLMFLSCDR